MNPTNPHRGAPAGAAPASARAHDSAPSEPAQASSDSARPASRLGAPSGTIAGGGRALAQPAPRRAPDPIHPADLQQAAYIVARQALGRPLTAESKNLLWTTNETLKETQAMLFHGRGNIETDVRDSGGESSHWMIASRKMKDGMNDEESIPSELNDLNKAAIASLAGAGNCREFTEVAKHLHSRHLGEGDRIMSESIDGLDHQWARVECATPVGGAPGSGPAAILDPWADGPVVEPIDSRHASGATLYWDRIDGNKGQATYDRFESTRGRFDDETAEMSALADGQRDVQGAEPITGGMMDPIPVVSEAFALQARNAIDQGSPTTLHASAVRALLDSRTPPPREQAEADAARVVGLARELDVPFPWPRNAFRPINED